MTDQDAPRIYGSSYLLDKLGAGRMGAIQSGESDFMRQLSRNLLPGESEED
jgi:hypothetical protein